MIRCSIPRFSGSLLAAIATAVSGSQPSVRWKPVSLVARDLPDDVQEHIGEKYGGLKNFLSEHTTLFDVSVVNGVLAVRCRNENSGQQLPAAPVVSNVMETRKDDTLMRFWPSAAQAASQRPLPSIPVAAQPSGSTSNLLARHTKDLSATEVAEVSVLAATFPDTLVPFVIVQQRIGKDLQDLWKRVVDNRKYLDVVNFDTLQEYLPSGNCLPANISSLWIRLAPAYSSCAFVDSLVSSTRALFNDYVVPEYEAFRLARFMSTSDFVALAGLEAAARDALSVPVPQVLLAFPQVFQVTKEGARYLLSVKYFDPTKGWKSFETEFAKMDVTELEALLKTLVAHKVGKELGMGKTMKLRRIVIHVLQRKRYPFGNVFQDPRVLAYHIFDLLPREGSLSTDEVRAFLPDNGRYTANISWQLFAEYPSLFYFFQEKPPVWRVMRADAPNRPTAKQLTAEDVRLLILSNLPKNFDSKRRVSASTIAMSLPLEAKTFIRDAGGWKRVLGQSPQSFKILEAVADDGNVWFHCTDPSIVASDQTEAPNLS